MQVQTGFPLLLKFQTKLFGFEIRWVDSENLMVEAVQLSQPQKQYHGMLSGRKEDVKSSISTIFYYLKQLKEMVLIDKIDYLSAVVSIVDIEIGTNCVFLMKIIFFDDLQLQFDIPLFFRLIDPKASQTIPKQVCGSLQIERLIDSLTVKDDSSNSENEDEISKQAKIYRRKIYKKILKDSKAKDNQKRLRKVRRQKQRNECQINRLTKQLEEISLH